MGYNLQEARKKGILTSRDHQERVQFPHRVKKAYPADFFQREICFFLNGVSFYHKRNPLSAWISLSLADDAVPIIKVNKIFSPAQVIFRKCKHLAYYVTQYIYCGPE